MGGALRFSIDCNGDGEMTVRVMPRRVGSKPQDCATLQQEQQQQQQQQQHQQPQQRLCTDGPLKVQAVQGRGSILCDLPLGASGAVRGASSVRYTPRLSRGRGSILSELLPDAASEDTPLRASVSSSPPQVECSTQEQSSMMRLQAKLDMPLDALVRGAAGAPATVAAAPCAPVGNDGASDEDFDATNDGNGATRAERRRTRCMVRMKLQQQRQDTNHIRLTSGSCESVPETAGDVTMIDASGLTPRARPQLPVAPCRPPGDHWTQYKDEDQNGNVVFWWHYEGPLGKWWTTDESKDPQLYMSELEK